MKSLTLRTQVTPKEDQSRQSSQSRHSPDPHLPLPNTDIGTKVWN